MLVSRLGGVVVVVILGGRQLGLLSSARLGADGWRQGVREEGGSEQQNDEKARAVGVEGDCKQDGADVQEVVEDKTDGRVRCEKGLTRLEDGPN